MFTHLMVISGAFWILTYILIINRGFRDKTYGMPLVALCFNISWEFIYTFLRPHPIPHIYSNIIALSLDIIIFYQLLLYWPNEFSNVSKLRFYLLLFSSLIVAFSLVFFISYMFNDNIGFYMSFGQNLLMSILFIKMLLNRSDLRGQTIYIASFKLFGTASASSAFYLFDPIDKGSILLNSLYLGIFLFDLLYVMMIYKKTR